MDWQAERINRRRDLGGEEGASKEAASHPVTQPAMEKERKKERKKGYVELKKGKSPEAEK